MGIKIVNVNYYISKYLHPGENVMGAEAAGGFFKRIFDRSRAVRATEEAKKKRETQQLVDGVKNARREWIIANMNFDSAESEELVDYFTYQIKAAEIKMGYFLKKIKEKNIRLPGKACR